MPTSKKVKVKKSETSRKVSTQNQGKTTAGPDMKDSPTMPSTNANPSSDNTDSSGGDGRRGHYIEVAAYFIAERHGFMAGRELDHWAEAEAEIDRLMKEEPLGV